MFTAALFTIVKAWKQPKCPSADEWIRKLWYIYTMEYCSAIFLFPLPVGEGEEGRGWVRPLALTFGLLPPPRGVTGGRWSSEQYSIAQKEWI